MRFYVRASAESADTVFFAFPSMKTRGEGGIRTLGSLLGYGALAKRCFRPLSHLTKICSHGTHAYDYGSESRISRRIGECQFPTAERIDLAAVSDRREPDATLGDRGYSW